MVKKKVKKRVVKKIVKNNNSNTDALRNDFEVFSKGVERLEELKSELNSLNTIGHEAEARSIRSKLKNVSYIPQIEIEIRELKSRIGGKSSKKKIGKMEGDVHVKINNKINTLKKEIESRKKGYKKQLSKDDVKSVKEIPKLESQISSLRKIIADQQESEKRKKELLKKIDPGVDFIINNQFDLSLNEIKAELSKKLKSKETEIQKQLQEDLEARKSNFTLKYKDLENKFHERYNEKVQKELQEEINNKFRETLREKVSEMKKGLENDAKIKLKLKEEELDRKKNIELEKARKFEAKKLEQIEIKRKKLLERLSLEQKRKIKGLIDAREKLTKDSMQKLGSEKSHLRNLLGEENMKKLNSQERKLKTKLQNEERRIVDELAIKNKILSRMIEKEKEKIFKQKRKQKQREFNQRKSEKLMNSSLEKKEKLMDINLRDKEEALKKYKVDVDNLKIKIETVSQKKMTELKKRLKESSNKEVQMINNKLSAEMSRNLADKIKQQLDLVNKKYMVQKNQEKKLINELKLRLSKEKVKDMALNEKELKVRLSRNDVNKLREKLLRNFQSNKRNLEREHRDKIVDEKAKLKSQFEEEILATRTKLNNQMHEHLTSEVKKLNDEYLQKRKDADNNVSQMKRKLASETGTLTRMKNNLSAEVRKIREDEDVYKRELAVKLEKEKQEAIKSKVKEQANLIGSKLKQEFNIRLKMEIKSKEAEIEKKKADLALDVQRKAKMLFG